jgi:hypothetical protein
MKVDHDIRKYYKMRSAIAPQRGSNNLPSDSEEFGSLVRQAGSLLLDKLGGSFSVYDLQNWVPIQISSTEPPGTPT